MPVTESYNEAALNVISATVSNKALTTNVATLTTSAAHGFAAGKTVTVTGVDATFNGTYTIDSVPTATTFTYAKTAADVVSVAATGSASIPGPVRGTDSVGFTAQQQLRAVNRYGVAVDTAGSLRDVGIGAAAVVAP